MLDSKRKSLAAAVMLLAALCAANAARAYTTESPEVKAMVQSGLAYLASSDEHPQVGGEALIGVTLVKNGYKGNHPRVAKAVRNCTTAKTRDMDNYSLSLVPIFLSELDPGKYRGTIDQYLKELFRRQDRQGAVWTYQGERLGDTSQTQYGVLAMWTAKQHGFDIPQDRFERSCKWLLRTQTPTGAWGYHCEDPGDYNRIQQEEQRRSVVAAALGSVYICADALGMASAPAQQNVRSGDLPPALVPVLEPVARRTTNSRAPDVPLQYLHRAQRDGNNWMQVNYSITQGEWPFYYLYALERYQSFREFAEDRHEKSPFWYNDGVNWLRSKQAKDGSFNATSSNVGVELATAFSILFLTRSTSKAIGLANEGRLHGGIGLPSNDSNMSLYGGRIVAADVSKSLGDMLNLLEDQKTDDLQDLISFAPDATVVIDDPQAYQEHVERLRKLAGHTSYEVRLVAVKTLGQTRDLDNVPTLIYALSDPDRRVARAARDGLRFISRRLDGFGMPDSANLGDRTEAINKWKEWYRSLRPDAELLASP